ncbi:MAG: M48 family metalloprotease [Flavobacteriaceae bacterium]|jgi:predicted Zn-dependent protease|nr:M48 family metalloprotease [Flavobacteriaceae bacterium]
MKYFAFFGLLFSAYISAQTPILLDTLNLSQRKALHDKYTKKTEVFLSGLGAQCSKQELKKVKSILTEEYDDIKKEINKNSLIVDSPLNQYLDALLANIREKNPNSPEIYLMISREFETNALNIGEGTIIINNYLLSNLDNEDQLVFVICHEIAHQSLNHVFSSVLNFVKKENSNEMKGKVKELKRKKYNNKVEAENLLKDIVYKNSKEQRKKESEADSLGYVYYSRLGRNKQQPVKTLENLKNSDYEGDSLKVADYKRMFSTSGLNFKEEWFKMDDYSIYHYKKSTRFNTDSLKTHPNIEDRIATLKKSFPESLDKKDPTPVTASATFDQWHNNAMHQNVYNEYISEHYGNSLYEALKLYNRKPTPFLKKMIGQNFQKLYEAQKAYRLNRYVSQVDVNDHTNSFNLFCTFINNLKLDDFKAFADTFSKE